MRMSMLRSAALGWLLLDLVVVALHLLRARLGAEGVLSDPRLALNKDRGLAEVLGYTQTMVAVALLTLVYLHKRLTLALAWAGVLLLIIADDALFLHERGGRWLAATGGLPAVGGLRSSDLGELAVWAALGGVTLLALTLGATTSAAPARRQFRPLAAAFCALVFFAVVMDVGHQALGSGTVFGVELDPALRFVEASGELLAMTGLAVAALDLFARSTMVDLTARPAGIKARFRLVLASRVPANRE